LIMKTVAIVPSAGRGIRIRSREAKPYLKLKGIPILARTLRALNSFSCVNEIIVAVDKSSKAKAEKIIKKYKINKVKVIIYGGATRFKSVLNCLSYLSDDTDCVVIHDGVRPFITENVTRRAIRVAGKMGACVVGVPLIPTLKKINGSLRVISTPPRNRLWAAQTPQVFKKALIVKAYNLARKRKIRPTDDSMLVELLGKRVKMVKGSYCNIKITTPEDLKFAEVLVKER